MKVVALLSFLPILLSRSLIQSEKRHSFFIDVYKEILKINDENLLVSPFFIEIILDWILIGAKGATAEEIVALPIEDTSLPDLTSNDYFLRCSNKIYLNTTIDVLKVFLDSKKNFSAEVENIRFIHSVQAAEVINLWVEDQCMNKIEELVKPEMLNEETSSIVINAMIFEAIWDSPFAELATQKKVFYRSKNEVVSIDTMFNYDTRNAYKYCENHILNAKVIELMFGNGDASMVIILPNEIDGIIQLERNMDEVLAPQAFTEEYVDIALPKFAIEGNVPFLVILQKMGLTSVFLKSEADLSGIGAKPNDLYVNDILQKTFLDVNEHGIGALETKSSNDLLEIKKSTIIPSLPRKQFIANHPFLFYIKGKGLILFIGRFAGFYSKFL